MMMKWYETASDDPGGIGLSRYFLAELVPPKFNGGVAVIRDPAPELLIGSPSATLAAIARQTFQNRFSAVTLSFAPDEIDVLEFNSGGPPRLVVARAINVFLECVFPGIPVAARPPVMVSTHVHTGRLELNVLVPKAVLTAGGYRSLNPCPPGSKTQKRWDLVAAFLCSAFGWRDPNDALSRRLVSHPDWVLKRRAEQIRAGKFDETGLRWVIERAAIDAYHEGADCRDRLLAELVPILEANRYHIATTAARSVTFKPDHGLQGETIQIKGLLFCSGHFLDAIGFYGAEHDPDERRQTLGTDLAHALAATAQHNRTRFDFDAAAAPEPDPFALLERPPRPLPPWHPGMAVLGFEAADSPTKHMTGSARRPGSPLGMSLFGTLVGLVRRVIRASADHLVSGLLVTSPFSNMKPTIDRWSAINVRLSNLVALRDARRAAGPAATGVACGAAGGIPSNSVGWNAEPTPGADQQRVAVSLGPDGEAYPVDRTGGGHTGDQRSDAGKAGRLGQQAGSPVAASGTSVSVAAMSPKTTGIVPSTGAVAMVEETSNLAKDHALKAESDHGSDVSAKPGILGELVPPETIPDFLVPMSQDDLAEWEDADEPGIGPA